MVSGPMVHRNKQILSDTINNKRFTQLESGSQISGFKSVLRVSTLLISVRLSMNASANCSASWPSKLVQFSVRPWLVKP